jgi:DNA-binding XRE family transcriptional regulator
MDYVCNGNTSTVIDSQSIQTAINLTEYFRATALKVYDKIYIDNTPPMNKKDVVKYCRSLGASQNEIAKAIKTSQQYIGKLLKE